MKLMFQMGTVCSHFLIFFKFLFYVRTRFLKCYVNNISCNSRLAAHPPRGSFVSVDGTDCRTFEPTRFSSKWYIHKYNGAALRYEVAISLYSNIVWVYGLSPAGSFSDDKIFPSSASFLEARRNIHGRLWVYFVYEVGRSIFVVFDKPYLFKARKN